MLAKVRNKLGLSEVLAKIAWHTLPGTRQKVGKVTDFLSALGRSAVNATDRALVWNRLFAAHGKTARLQQASLYLLGRNPWVGFAAAFKCIYELLY